jgi:hypothetical protein
MRRVLRLGPLRFDVSAASDVTYTLASVQGYVGVESAGVGVGLGRFHLSGGVGWRRG